MRILFYIAVTLLTLNPCFGQGWVNNGARLVLKNNVHIVVHTPKGNFLNKSTGLITTTNGGTLHVRGNWINNASNPAIGNNGGTVMLDGDSQRITGSRSTSFNNLVFKGNGDKWMDLNTLVGGGYAGVKTGQLDLGKSNLNMASRSLIVNNSASNAIITGTGLIIGETNPFAGYTKVQWNIRNATTGSSYTVPFGTIDRLALPITLELSSVGTQATDSGFVSFSTYPTNSAASPNNRPMPTGMTNLNNEFGLENDFMTSDRFYILTTGGYSTKPQAGIVFPYIDREWDATAGSRNQITEADLQPAKYDLTTNLWDHKLSGTTSVAGNFTKSMSIANLDGVYVLFNRAPCPIANFTVNNACLDKGIKAIDSSYVRKGTIDRNEWLTQSSSFINTDTLNHSYPMHGNYTIKRKVRSDRGCWDSITKSTTVFPLPVASFRRFDTCFNELTTLEATSTTISGMPLVNNWSYESTGNAGNRVYHTFSDTGTHSVELISTNLWGCADTLIGSIQIEPQPLVDFDFQDICERDLATFTNLSASKGSLLQSRWSVNDNVASFATNYTQRFNNRGGYDIELRVLNIYGCLDSLTLPIVVKPRAGANFSYFPKEIFITEPHVNLVEQCSNTTFWEWEFGDLSPTEFGPEVFHTYADTGVFSIRLIANNDENCPDTLYRAIRIKPYLRIYIPNAFSPGDENEINNTFGPAGMLYGLKEMTMEIYNRWGEQLYYSNDINKPWDGMYMGVLVKEGTYLYTIKMKDIYNQVAWHKGTVTVVR